MNRLLELLSFFMRLARGLSYSRSLIFLVVVTGIITGAVNTALLALTNQGLNRDAASPGLLAGFVGLCLLLPVARFSSSALMVYLTQQTQFDIRLKLCRRILTTPLRKLEELGPHRLLATLTGDIGTITTTLTNLPSLCVNAALVLGCLAYLGWLSPVALVGVLVLLGFGVVTYQAPIRRGIGYMRSARDDYDELFGHMRGLTEGAKELKLHGARQEAFMSELVESAASSNKRNNVRGSLIYAAANAWGQLLFFIAIGLLIFALPRFEDLGRETMTGYALTLLYMAAPLQAILATLPTLARARIAMERVERFGLSLVTSPGERVDPGAPPPDPTWRRLELRSVSHAYRREGDGDEFVLGPVDLVLSPGELVFVIGGNGSGKTTLAKLIVGLYVPEGGELRLDGEAVRTESLARYRQLFTAVFQDGFLFDQLLGLGEIEVDRRAEEYLRLLGLDQKVRVQDGRLSTVELSRGQRKRLALLTAYLEDRPIYLFDEWAADQDPLFKELFYRQLLPDLRDRGKTILVISHDDTYYDVGERVLKLEHGKLIFDGSTSKLAPRVLSTGRH